MNTALPAMEGKKWAPPYTAGDHLNTSLGSDKKHLKKKIIIPSRLITPSLLEK